MPNPVPAEIVNGRPVLYESTDASAYGDQSCFSCRMFADTDHISWDLGDPNGKVIRDPNPNGGLNFHPMKGPMATQSLRGMANHGPMHWRGDRTGALNPGGDFADSDAAFHQFNPAFVGLLGRATQLAKPDMDRFTNFILTVTYPPNPIRALDNSLTPSQREGENVFNNFETDPIIKCSNCHTLDVSLGFFGTHGASEDDSEPQFFKIPHLRNDYQKVGMFGRSGGNFGIPRTEFMGDQIRGFGFSTTGARHDHWLPTLSPVQIGRSKRRICRSPLAFDSNMASIRPAYDQRRDHRRGEGPLRAARRRRRRAAPLGNLIGQAAGWFSRGFRLSDRRQPPRPQRILRCLRLTCRGLVRIRWLR